MTDLATSAVSTARRGGGGPRLLLRGLLTGVATGAAVAAFVVGMALHRAPWWGGGIALFALTWAVVAVAGLAGRLREPVPERRTALARIESRRAISGELADVPVTFDLTVAPEGRPSYRVRIIREINLVDLLDYPEHGVVVVRYPVDAPWNVTIVPRPTPEWRERAAGAVIRSAPESRRVTKPSRGAAYRLIGVAGMLAGAAVVVLVNRAPLSDDHFVPAPRPPAGAAVDTGAEDASDSTSFDVGQFILAKGQLRTLVDSVVHGGTPAATHIRLDEHAMVLSGTGTGSHPARGAIPLRSLPLDRIPALVQEARTTLGVRAPAAWRVDIARTSAGADARADAGAGAVDVHVTVTGAGGAASLDADANGRVTHRDPR